MYNIWNVVVDIVHSRLTISNTILVQNRTAICKNCELRNTKLNTCTVCGCWIWAKVRVQKSSCPIDNW